MIRRPPRSTLFPYTTALPISAPGCFFHSAIVSRTAGSSGSTGLTDRKSTRLNSSHGYISYAVFCLKKKQSNLGALEDHDRHAPRVVDDVHSGQLCRD